jgi:phosphatidylinositol glycan class O
MEPGEVFTPLSEITGPAATAKVNKPKQDTPKQPAPRIDQDEAKKIGQVHFKAAHGIIVAFFTLILYIASGQLAEMCR